MSKIEVNQIASQCGSTLTVGQSGDTVTLASGATQSGFGRTGTVDWDTTAKTAAFTAVSGNGYFVNTSSSAITVTLPASPSSGDIVAVKDYAGTAETNNITIARNSSNIRGEASDFVFEKNNAGANLIYVDATEGWQIFLDGSDSDAQNTFICASGGTETTCGDFKIHTFTGPGTFTVNSIGCSPARQAVDYMVAAGGGGGGNFGGGGGGGGFRESCGTCYTSSPLGSCVSALSVTAQAYPITVGAGGSAGTPTTPTTQGADGSNSIFSTITSTGGGGGGGNNPPSVPIHNGRPGGSGGGESQQNAPSANVGSGNTPPVSPPQGNPGGTATGFQTPHAAGAGGGATAAGGNASSGTGGTGGTGATSSINGTPTGRAGGGGGGGTSGGTSCKASTCGSGATSCSSASANTGGGGGGSRSSGNAGAGGSGIVIIRYKYQ